MKHCLETRGDLLASQMDEARITNCFIGTQEFPHAKQLQKMARRGAQVAVAPVAPGDHLQVELQYKIPRAPTGAESRCWKKQRRT